jgi:hypothetical protein
LLINTSIDPTKTSVPRLRACWEVTGTAGGGTRLIQRWHLVTPDRQEQVGLLKEDAA